MHTYLHLDIRQVVVVEGVCVCVCVCVCMCVCARAHAIAHCDLKLDHNIIEKQLYVSFAKEPYKIDFILPKRPMILRSLRMAATPYDTIWRV